MAQLVILSSPVHKRSLKSIIQVQSQAFQIVYCILRFNSEFTGCPYSLVRIFLGLLFQWMSSFVPSFPTVPCGAGGDIHFILWFPSLVPARAQPSLTRNKNSSLCKEKIIKNSDWKPKQRSFQKKLLSFDLHPAECHRTFNLAQFESWDGGLSLNLIFVFLFQMLGRA